MIRAGNFLFRYRKFVLVPMLFVLCALFPPQVARGSERLEAGLDLLGFLVALAGQGLRAAVIGFAYIKRGGLDGQVYASNLVTQGFFSHSRNPLYLGNLLILTGLLIIYHSPWVYLIGLPFAIFVYRAIVAAEESYLRSKFGEEYENYCRRVNRWLPDLRGLGRTLEGMRFNWRRLLVKEYGTAYGWMAGALILLALESPIHARLGQEALYFRQLGAILSVLTAAWATVRYLKKKRLLTQNVPASRA